jgi:hypothetical protein
MEAALRSVVEFITGLKVEDLYEHADIVPVRGFDGIKYLEVKIPDKVGPVPEIIRHLVPDWNWAKGATLKFAVAHGTANAKRIMEDIKAGGKFSECHFIEIMGCPGGCIGGGGQPIPTSPEIRAARARAIYAEDAAYAVRKSHENEAVLRPRHLRGGCRLRRAQVARERSGAPHLQGVPDRRTVRAQEPSPPAHALHQAREVHRVGGRRERAGRPLRPAG